jgi:hypothetical protein
MDHAAYSLVKISDPGTPDMFAIRHHAAGLVAWGYTHVLECLKDVAHWNALDAMAWETPEHSRSATARFWLDTSSAERLDDAEEVTRAA